MNEIACAAAMATKMISTGGFDLEKFFDLQMRALLMNGCGVKIVATFMRAKKDVLEMATSIPISSPGNIPFVSVLQFSFTGGLHKLATLVRQDGRVGRASRESDNTRNIGAVPSGPYFMFDVEDGSSTLGLTPIDADALIKRRKRLRSTIAEVVSIGACTEMLQKMQYMYALASRTKSGNILSLWADNHGPRIDCRPFDGGAHPRWGSPSCKSRVAI